DDDERDQHADETERQVDVVAEEFRQAIEELGHRAGSDGARGARGTGPRIIRDVGAGGKERAGRRVTRPSAFSRKAFGNKGFVERSLQRWMRCDVRQAQQAALYGKRGTA